MRPPPLSPVAQPFTKLSRLSTPLSPSPAPLPAPTPTLPTCVAEVENRHSRVMKKQAGYGLTDGWMDGQTDPHVEMRGRI